MAKTIVINGITYTDVPFTESPLASNPSQTAKFYDTSDATLDNGNKMLDGVTGYGNGVKYTGSIQSKAAQTYTPTTSDQTINSGQFIRIYRISLSAEHTLSMPIQQKQYRS